MSRKKKQYINKLTTKDTKMLKAFGNVGYLTPAMLKEDLEIADRRIKNFTRDGYIEKVSYLDRKTKNAEQLYRLTDKGKKLCANNLGTNYFYHTASPNHDLKLAEIYLKQPEEIQQHWKTENELRDIFKEHIAKLDYVERDRYMKMLTDREISPADGGYVVDNQIVLVEVITTNYRETDIQAKTEFASVLGASYNQYKA